MKAIKTVKATKLNMLKLMEESKGDKMARIAKVKMKTMWMKSVVEFQLPGQVMKAMTQATMKQTNQVR